MEQKSNRREFTHKKELSGDGRACEQLTYIVYNSHVTCSKFLFFVNNSYAHDSLPHFPLVMLSASHCLLAQARFCVRTHLSPSPNSITSTGQGDIPISSTGCSCFNIQRIHSTCGHGDILAITLLIFWCPRCVMVKAMNCGIVVRQFVLQSRYYVHFRANTLGKGMNPLILPPTMGK